MVHAVARPLGLGARRVGYYARLGGRRCFFGVGVARGELRRRASSESERILTSQSGDSAVHGDPEHELGAPTGALLGVVTRRHTLGRKLTFVDLTVAGEDVGTNSESNEISEIFVFSKCWGLVDKRVKVGAVVEVSGRLLTNPPRLRDTELSLLKPGSLRVSVPEQGVELITPQSAEDVANASPFLEQIISTGDTNTKSKPLIRRATTDGSTSKKPSLQAVARLCKSFLVNGACADPRCQKRHAFASEAEASTTEKSRRKAKSRSCAAVEREADPEDPHGTDSKAAKQHSDRLFAEWVMETFRRGSGDDESGLEVARAAGSARTEETVMEEERTSSSRLSSPSKRPFTIADIAGGGGTLSWELHVRHGCNTTLIDPAFVSLSPKQLGTWRNLRKRAAKSGEKRPAWTAWRRAERWVEVAAQEDESRKNAHIKRVLVNTDAVHSQGTADVSGRSVGVSQGSVRCDKGGALAVSTDSKTDSNTSVAAFRHFPELFWGDLDSATGKLLQKCDVLLGMHPDQATETIVDTALRLKKPFAIVPCCVFPETFPDRKLKNGKQVRTYVQFLEYLREKDPGIETAYLPFEGRSRVLFKR